MKKVKKLIIPLMLMVSLLVLSLTGCGRSAKDKYYEDGSKLGYMLGTGIQDNVGLFGPKDEAKDKFIESADAAISEIKGYKMETKEGKAAKKSIIELKKQQKAFYLKYTYGDNKGTTPSIDEELKKYTDDVNKKIKAFDKKYHKNVGEDLYW